MLYVFARREFGLGVATMTAALYVTSPQILASGRMLMTHSNILFTIFTTASFIAFYYFVRGPGPGQLVCAASAGVSATVTALPQPLQKPRSRVAQTLLSVLSTYDEPEVASP